MCEEFLYDRCIHFDIAAAKLNMQKGEKTLFLWKDVEDIKGNPDQLGSLVISNTRILWWSERNNSVNLSIGLGTIFHIEQKVTNNNRTFGTLFRTKLATGQKYEFHFSSQDKKLYESLINIQRLYTQTMLHREIKVQFAMISQKKLNTSEKEQIINQYANTISVANDQQDVSGTLIFTNVRFVWYSATNDLFNISIPWIAVKKISKKTTKGLYTMIIETYQEFGGYYVGYRNIDMDSMIKECNKLHAFHTENPIYGIEIQEKQQPTVQRFDEKVQVVQSIYNQAARYQANENNDIQNDIAYSPELGLAIQKLPADAKLSEFWNIIKY
ncbi:unnamed protein product (macronuclear) [Paramecium tetraurelia]|uniref:BBSome complex member BBS5 n=1 Tax=Paramecium tetraurelia TaxID=5888 RepID=Q3SCX0_PARTE|nr:uncharacterized protein GSPATT00034169001 [Paramecium tetraurelia]CAI44718.1 BBS5, putative [Paramecium tetraurelia]CAK64692.1 unnamed protein product [Paramecium tetraurelia]|eukprot:XP_001432089.1 hypothetical protein (macronuclear) [Paramecium tetraurelia strain d4-2]